MVQARRHIGLTLTALGMLIVAGCVQQEAPPTDVRGDEPAVVASLDAPSTTERVELLLEEGGKGGTVGLYLRELDGPVHASLRSAFLFEPASTIKALIHFHALRWVQEQAADAAAIAHLLDETTITLGSTGCPAGPLSGSLRVALGAMMIPSRNDWTRALQLHFGADEIDATRIALGMTTTQYRRVLGCGGLPGGVGADPATTNHMTLVDAGKMYEAVATGYLNDDVRAAGFPGLLMVTHASLFDEIVAEESAGLGLTASAVGAFRSARVSANKPGGVTLNDGKGYSSLAGWARLAFKDDACEIVPREYVYGVFRHGRDADHEFVVSTARAATELFREQIRAGLASWAACEADLQVLATGLVDPPAEIDVHTPTTLTVRHQVRNNGPAAVIDARVITTTSAPADCTVDPSLTEPLTPGLALGEVRTIDVPVVLTCADPSFHTVEVRARIEPTNPNVRDPVGGNNLSTSSVVIAVIAHADLAVASWDVAALDAAGLGDVLVGQDFTFDTGITVRNHGDTAKGLYADPVDATVAVSLEIPAGLRGSVIDGVLASWTDGPATIQRDVPVAALAVGADRLLEQAFGLHCLEPGEHEIRLRSAITPDDEHILDPDPTNDALEIERTVECITPVQINVRPGNVHNAINPTSAQTVPVAILTTEAGEYGLPLAFDATAALHTSVRFGTREALQSGGGSALRPDRDFLRDSFEMDDQTKDGDVDMVLLARSPGSGVTAQTSEVCLVGSYVGDDANVYTCFGCDAVTTVGAGG